MLDFNDIKTIHQLTRVGCSALGWTLNKKTGYIKLHCSILTKYECKNVGCYPELCPKVQEKIPIEKSEPVYEAYFDGSATPNPGARKIGGYILDPTSRKKVATYSQDLGYGTNNEAEYLSLYHLSMKIRDLGIKKVKIYGDSKLVVNQVNGV